MKSAIPNPDWSAIVNTKHHCELWLSLMAMRSRSFVRNPSRVTSVLRQSFINPYKPNTNVTCTTTCNSVAINRWIKSYIQDVKANAIAIDLKEIHDDASESNITKSEGTDRNNYAKCNILQIAVERNVLMVNLNQLQQIPIGVVTILCNQYIKKVGINIKSKLSRLYCMTKFPFNNYVDIGITALRVEGRDMSLEEMAEKYLKKLVPKPNLLEGFDWERKEYEQNRIKFAAEETIAIIRIFRYFESKRAYKSAARVETVDNIKTLALGSRSSAKKVRTLARENPIYWRQYGNLLRKIDIKSLIDTHGSARTALAIILNRIGISPEYKGLNHMIEGKQYCFVAVVITGRVVVDAVGPNRKVAGEAAAEMFLKKFLDMQGSLSKSKSVYFHSGRFSLCPRFLQEYLFICPDLGEWIDGIQATTTLPVDTPEDSIESQESQLSNEAIPNF